MKMSRRYFHQHIKMARARPRPSQGTGNSISHDNVGVEWSINQMKSFHLLTQTQRIHPSVQSPKLFIILDIRIRSNLI